MESINKKKEYLIIKEKKKLSSEELAALCAAIADDRKAENIMQLDLKDISSITDYFVICTANSEPHLRAVAERIRRDVRDKCATRPNATDGERKAGSEWIILDYSNVIVHIMTPRTRDLYQLENLWGDAPCVKTIEKIEEITST